MKLSYLGPKGTFTEEACLKYNNSSEYIECPTIDRVIAAVRDKKADEGIIPIENSIEGSVNLTLDLLMEEDEIRIKDEVLLPIRHNLISTCDEISAIDRVISHPQALAQCYRYVRTHLPDVKIFTTDSTAKAALIAAQEKATAAIGTLRAAQLYGLNVLDKSIQDFDNNITRFVVISCREGIKTDNCKTSIIFSTENKPGSLYEVLKEFAEKRLNLTKIESRPSKKVLGEYIFFLDVEGHKDDSQLSMALKKVREKTNYFRILGSYPKGQVERGN